MQAQNVHFFRGNKSHSPAQISIHQLPSLYPIKPPNISLEAFKPLNMDFFNLKQSFEKSLSTKQTYQRQQPSKIQSSKQSRTFTYPDIQALQQQNQQLNKQLNLMNEVLESEKQKYHELKNLYKEGQVMFEMLEQKKNSLEKQNKQIRIILQNVLKELHQKNEHFQSTKTQENPSGQRKIQKVKIGSKQIPVIKVNVPAQTFSKKDHSSSVFSVNGDHEVEQLKEQISKLRQQNERLVEANNKLTSELTQVRKSINPNESFQLYLSSSDKESIQNQVPNTYSSNYRDSQNSINYFRSKYAMLETQLRKKDETLKNLYDQIYILQAQINRLKSTSSKTNEFSIQTIHLNKSSSQTQTFPFKHGQTQAEFYKRKIIELQTQINELNQICIANVNNSFKLNELNEIISKLTKQNFIYQEKMMSQDSELKRLYKILENKNTQLSEIYTVITETKKSQLFDGSKLFEGSKKKSFDSFYENTPQKMQDSARKRIVFEKQSGHQYPTQ